MQKIALLVLYFSLTMSHATAAAEAEKIPSVTPVHSAVPPALSADVKSLDGIIAAMYDVISGGIGAPRDWLRLRSLFIPEARIQAIAPKKEGGYALRLLSVSDYIANSGPVLIDSGFREKELNRRVENWGELTQVWSAYEGTREKQKDSVRGINAIQLMFDGQRWWIVSLLFEAERADLALPANMTAPKS